MQNHPVSYQTVIIRKCQSLDLKCPQWPLCWGLDVSNLWYYWEVVEPLGDEPNVKKGS